MNLKSKVLLMAAITGMNAVAADKNKQPNIIIILADDLGYKDVSYMGCKDIQTPNIDAIAKNGVWFTNGYTTCPVCAPSRAGLLTGRYQNRFGFEDNPGPYRRTKETIPGIPLREKNLGEYFKEIGYNTAIIGKWHEENVSLRNPVTRGFDKFFGFINGASSYYINDNHKGKLLREERPVEKEDEYLTDALGREANLFIERNNDRGKPFLLYVPFNAVHGPFQAPEEYIKKFNYIKDAKRRVLAAMIYSLDENVGRITSKVKELGLEENTLIFFYSDNGGILNLSDNGTLRSGKGDIYEGGIRIPFCMQWKGHLPENKKIDFPVISLDILPTAIAATGNIVNKEWRLDGENLLPFISGEKQGIPHNVLYWRFLWHHAIRKGDWKLLKHRDHPDVELYNLAEDIGEQNDLSKARPEKVKELQQLYTDWSDVMLEPQWGWQPGYCGSYKVEK
ncbi:MAG: sulfatase [Bacteroidota bacterium]|nr:sulfatase [Bacteroidota bacterium]